jgi:hypothetical protein
MNNHLQKTLILASLAIFLSPMSATAKSWNGTFTVKNETGQEITNLYVDHRCGKLFDSVYRGKLASNATTAPTVLHGQSGSDDIWSLRFKVNGKNIARKRKQCNFEPEDANQNVMVVLQAGGFDIHYPASDSCKNNRYD